MPEMSSCLNLAKTVKPASAELLFIQFAAGCTNVGVTPYRPNGSIDATKCKVVYGVSPTFPTKWALSKREYFSNCWSF